MTGVEHDPPEQEHENRISLALEMVRGILDRGEDGGEWPAPIMTYAQFDDWPAANTLVGELGIVVWILLDQLVKHDMPLSEILALLDEANNPSGPGLSPSSPSG